MWTLKTYISAYYSRISVFCNVWALQYSMSQIHNCYIFDSLDLNLLIINSFHSLRLVLIKSTVNIMLLWYGFKGIWFHSNNRSYSAHRWVWPVINHGWNGINVTQCFSQKRECRRNMSDISEFLVSCTISWATRGSFLRDVPNDYEQRAGCPINYLIKTWDTRPQLPLVKQQGRIHAANNSHHVW